MKKTRYLLLLLIIILLFHLPSFSLATNKNETTTKDEITTYSQACILMDANTGRILYEKNSSNKAYPASTTKIMTAILTVEHCKLTDIATVSRNAIYSVPSSYVQANLHEGEELTIEQLLNILLIPSANDAANVLAEHIAGSVENFATLMNKKAKEIGCLNTHFVNPNGVHNKDHTTTAYDLALMGRYAMQNSIIRNIVKKTKYTLPETNKYNKADRSFVTSNDLIRKNDSNAKDNYYYPYAIGIKTGYTSEAGSCIIAGAAKNNMEMIVVILGGGTNEDGLSQRYLDCKNLFNYAFENYSVRTLQEKNNIINQITIDNATNDTKSLNIMVQNEISALVKNSDLDGVKPTITINDNMQAPISANSVVGKITYQIGNETYSSDLIAEHNVVPYDITPTLIKIALLLVTILLIFLLLRKPKKKTLKKMYTTKKLSKKRNTKGKGKHDGGNFRSTFLNNF